jgi:hypothetical protein
MSGNVDQINRVLVEECPDMIFLTSFGQPGSELVLAFTFNGGPEEDRFYVVRFSGAAVFHIPSIIHTRLAAPLMFKIAPHFEADKYIPSISFDEEEFGERGYKIYLLTTTSGEETGYYVAAEAVESEWISRENGRRKWNIC